MSRAVGQNSLTSSGIKREHSTARNQVVYLETVANFLC